MSSEHIMDIVCVNINITQQIEQLHAELYFIDFIISFPKPMLTNNQRGTRQISRIVVQ